MKYAKVLVVDLATGEKRWRDLTGEEAQVRDQIRQAAEARAAEAAEKEAGRRAAIARLKADPAMRDVLVAMGMDIE